jgi:hypothetical protein
MFNLAIGQEDNEEVSETFSSIRIINGQSTETLKQREFRYIIGHRFGDVGGEQGGVQTAFGFDDAADIRFGFDFGIRDDVMVGIARLKGNGAPYRSIIESFAKYRFLTQKETGMPISAAITGNLYATYMPSSEDITSVTNFQEFAHRVAYSSQLTIARKFHPRFSVALMPTYVHRNYVRFDDVNGLFSIGAAANIKVFKRLGLVAEYFYNFEPEDLREPYKNNLSVAMEWLTNGHVFSFHFTNARGMGDLQYIALNTSDWLEGQFRFGFTITRTFKF